MSASASPAPLPCGMQAVPEVVVVLGGGDDLVVVGGGEDLVVVGGGEDEVFVTGADAAVVVGGAAAVVAGMLDDVRCVAFFVLWRARWRV